MGTNYKPTFETFIPEGTSKRPEMKSGGRGKKEENSIQTSWNKNEKIIHRTVGWQNNNRRKTLFLNLL